MPADASAQPLAKPRWGLFVVLAVLFGALLLSLMAWQAIATRERQLAEMEFQTDAADVVGRIEQRLLNYDTMLNGGVALFEAVSYPGPAQWSSFVQGLQLQTRYPELTGLGYAVYASQSRLMQLQEMWRSVGQGYFQLRPQGMRPDYGAILYLEPRTPENITAVGFDMLSEPVRGAAMLAARDRGQSRMTGAVRLVQDGDNPVPGGLIYTPVYRSGDRPVSVAERRASLQGWVYVPFRWHRLLGSTLADAAGKRRSFLRAVDITEGQAPMVLYEDSGFGKASQDQQRISRHVMLGMLGRQWRLEFVSMEPGLGLSRERYVRSALLVGLMATLLLTGLTLMLFSTEKRARMLADRMTAALRESEERVRGLNRTLEARVSARTRALSEANDQLEMFAYSVSHDLRAPLRSILGFARRLRGSLNDPEASNAHLARIEGSAQRMNALIDALLKLSHVRKDALKREPLDLSAMANEILAELQEQDPFRKLNAQVQPGLVANADPALVRNLLQNLLGNAWKFTAGKPVSDIGLAQGDDGMFVVHDNGAGFDEAYAQRLFRAFQRLHGEAEFEGHGIGLATVRTIVLRHGGQVRAEGRLGEGARFYFSLPDPPSEG